MQEFSIGGVGKEASIVPRDSAAIVIIGLEEGAVEGDTESEMSHTGCSTTKRECCEDCEYSDQTW